MKKTSFQSSHREGHAWGKAPKQAHWQEKTVTLSHWNLRLLGEQLVLSTLRKVILKTFQKHIFHIRQGKQDKLQ